MSIGVSLPQVALINAAFFLTIALMELPTGMIADGRSRVWSVRAGALLGGLGFLAYVFAEGFWHAVACEIVVGISFAFTSGSLEAWVTDAVGRDGEKLRRTFGTGIVFSSIGVMTGGIISSPLSALDLRYGIIVSGLLALVAFAFSCLAMGKAGEPAVRTSELTALRDSFGALRGNSALRWALAACAAFALVLSFNHYWAPFFRARVGQAGLAIVWPAIYGGCLVGGYAVRRWANQRGHECTAVVLSIVVTGLAMAFVGLAGGLVAPIMLAFVHEIGRGAFRPLIEAFVQQRIDSSFRATYGSLQSLISRVGFAAVLGVVWLLTRQIPDGDGLIVLTWVVQGILLALVAVLLWLFRPRQEQ
jgi:hypothetical protein